MTAAERGWARVGLPDYQRQAHADLRWAEGTRWAEALRSATRTAPPPATPGYTVGPGGGEQARHEVCAHRLPLGWACYRCAHDEGTVGTRPARRADPPRFVLRAVCQTCESRVWLDEETR